MEERHLCANYNEWTGECCLSRPYCCTPFSDEDCLAFQKRVASAHKYQDPDKERSWYTPSEQVGFEPKTWKDVVKYFDIHEGVVIAKYFLSDETLEMFAGSIDDIFEFYRRAVKLKFAYGKGRLMHVFAIRGFVQPGTDSSGTLFLGIGSKED